MVVLFLLSKKPAGSVTDSDLDALTKMLIAETGFDRGEQEMAQIVFVALNRAKKYKTTAANIVSPPGRPVVWNTGALYRQRFEAARSNKRWAAAQAFIMQVLAGAYRNLGATMFIHPGAMPAPPCADNRVAASTVAGSRCIPEWSVGSRVVGGAMFT